MVKLNFEVEVDNMVNKNLRNSVKPNLHLANEVEDCGINPLSIVRSLRSDTHKLNFFKLVSLKISLFQSTVIMGSGNSLKP